MDLKMMNLLCEKEHLMSTSRVQIGKISAYCNKNNLSEIALHPNCLGYDITNPTGSVNFQKNCGSPDNNDDGCRLVLGLGPSPNFYSADYSSSGANTAKESLSPSQSFFGAEMLKLGLSGENADISIATSTSNLQARPSTFGKSLLTSILDEGSTSAKKKSGGYMPSLLFAPHIENASGSIVPSETCCLFDFGSDASIHPPDQQHDLLSQQLQLSPEPSITVDCSFGGITDSMMAVSGASTDQRAHPHYSKKCRFKGCSKGARGSSGLCIAHGGGQRCQKPGCNKGAESRTVYCKAHGGGRRCQQLGCTKSAEGKTDFCIAHGGGRRCSYEGCSKASRGKTGRCIRHGGGKRCSIEGCMRSAEGQKGLCISHGGGRRCQQQGCNKGAQGSTMFCKAHGGGKRCIFEGCTKGAEGSTPLCKGHGGGKRCLFEGGGLCPKSVHGGTDFCVAHGGGKRCAVPGCTKSARGRTDCCVRHGGGKRCKFEGCGKSAQGSTDFCKAHGGGKRCTYPTGCEKFARGKSGLCAAHGSLMASKQGHESMRKTSMIGPGLFQGIVSTCRVGSSNGNEHTSSGLSTLSECVESSQSVLRKQPLIPPQVLVPLSMKCSSPSEPTGQERENHHSKSFSFMVPEGRVHGGGLMSLLGGRFDKDGMA